MENISEVLTIGFDSRDDGASLVVMKHDKYDSALTILKEFTGEAAIDIYNMLTSGGKNE